MAMTRIRWTSNETRKVVLAAAKKLNEGYRIGEALIAAQQILDPDRQRPADSLKSAVALAKEAKKEAARIVNKLSTSVEPVVVAPQPEVPKDISIDDLVQAIATKLANSLRSEVIKVVKELEHEFKVAKNNPEYAATGQRKPRVIIIGLREDQMAMIEHEYANRYALYFLTADDAKSGAISTADAYLLMKNFISHAVYDKYQIYKNHVLIDGGMTALRGWLSTKGAEL